MSLSMKSAAPLWIMGCLVILYFPCDVHANTKRAINPFTSVCAYQHNGFSHYLWTCQRYIRCGEYGQPSLHFCGEYSGFNPDNEACEEGYRYPGCFDEYPPPPPTEPPCEDPSERFDINSGKYNRNCFGGKGPW